MNYESVVQVNFAQNFSSPEFEDQPADGRSLGKDNMRHCKVTCQFELDVGPGEM